ncbi:MAG TPA: alpha/beta fold hydrolase [Thermomicrobiales bacterium]|nr:alpha/beta fold hydrolase [Thermomicrobiales bacterium]
MGTRTAAERLAVPSQDGTPIALWKRGAGPALLAVHGTGADHTAWDGVVPLLTDSFTVYAMDRRGRGASGDAPAYALEREVEDVAAALDALPGPVHLYGHSFGGTCAIEAALRTQNLGRLVLYEGGPKPPGLRLFPDDFVARLDALIQTGQREEALTTFMLTAAGVTPDELEVLRRQPAWPGRLAAVHTIPRELRAFNDYGPDLARFGAIEAPVLLVTGELTEPRRREMFERLTQVFQNARVAVLPGQRHAAHQTAPDLLAAALRDFLLADA